MVHIWRARKSDNSNNFLLIQTTNITTLQPRATIASGYYQQRETSQFKVTNIVQVGTESNNGHSKSINNSDDSYE
jgi:hypothetical protein